MCVWGAGALREGQAMGDDMGGADPQSRTVSLITLYVLGGDSFSNHKIGLVEKAGGETRCG
jgi:hypothetical protein